ncbi:MAG: DUF4476 domain-containing protein [Bacteroidetes bacterium]|nr:DUF4476 domain-containing protein [Bacteroidota bacterium]
MRSIFLILGFSILVSSLMAQLSDVVIFSEQGERFSVVVNGILQNAEPETNIKVEGLDPVQYQVKIIFEDQNLGQLDKMIMFNPETLTTFVIKKNNDGKYVLRWMSEAPVHSEQKPVQRQTVVVYSSTPRPVETVTHTQTTTTVTTVEGTPGGVSATVVDPDTGAEVNVSVAPVLTGAPQTTTTTTTTTTTSGRRPLPPEQTFVLEGYNGPVGCPMPMSVQDFGRVKQTIENQSFDDSKLKIAKQVLQSNCLLCSQVKEIMLLFSFEKTRLDFAKFAYGRTFDLGNYFQLNDAFTFESSIDELNEFITGGGE